MRNSRIVVLVLVFSAFAVAAFALSMGQRVSTVALRDSADSVAYIPDIGKKVVTVYYNDKQSADFTDPIATATKNKNYPSSKFRGQGIANMVDSKGIPDMIIRMAVRAKEKKFDTKILTDPSHLLKNAWGLGNCDNLGVVIIIGKDRKVKFFKKVSSTAQGRSLVSKVISVIESELKK